MSKLLFSSLSILTVTGGILAGCSNSTVNSQEKQPTTPAQQKEVTNNPPEPVKDDKGRVILETVGQKTQDSNASAELMKIKKVNQSISISPITLSIQDMKIIKLSHLSNDYERYLLQFTDGQKLPSDVNYLQITYTSENTSDKNVQFLGIDKLVLNTGEQIEVNSQDFIFEKQPDDGQYFGQVKKEGTIGVFIKGNPADVKWVKFITGDTENPDSYDTITKEQQAQFDF